MRPGDAIFEEGFLKPFFNPLMQSLDEQARAALGPIVSIYSRVETTLGRSGLVGTRIRLATHLVEFTMEVRVDIDMPALRANEWLNESFCMAPSTSPHESDRIRAIGREVMSILKVVSELHHVNSSVQDDLRATLILCKQIEQMAMLGLQLEDFIRGTLQSMTQDVGEALHERLTQRE